MFKAIYPPTLMPKMVTEKATTPSQLWGRRRADHAEADLSTGHDGTQDSEAYTCRP